LSWVIRFVPHSLQVLPPLRVSHLYDFPLSLHGEFPSSEAQQGAVPPIKYLNNIVEQDHRNVERLTRPDLDFGGFWTARRTLSGYEAMARLRKGQVRNISGNDIRAEATEPRWTISRRRLRGERGPFAYDSRSNAKRCNRTGIRHQLKPFFFMEHIYLPHPSIIAFLFDLLDTVQRTRGERRFAVGGMHG
jgi:hypothetical protein